MEIGVRWIERQTPSSRGGREKVSRLSFMHLDLLSPSILLTARPVG